MSKVYQIITDKIVKALESGVIPWRKPWRTIGGFPRNLTTDKPYCGINAFLTMMQRFGSPYWLTMKQANDRGGRIRKGEHSTAIVFWKTFDDKVKTDKNGKPVKIWMLRYYNVWNVEQIDGIEYPNPVIVSHDPMPVCEAVIENWEDKPEIRHDKPEIRHDGSLAYYSRANDYINMPQYGLFDNPEEYYSTLFHEAIHATGHEKRLNRDLSGRFGTGSYSREELVAEMGAAFICGHCGIENKTLENSAAYIQTWIGRLKSDPKLVVTAASKGQKASEYILNGTSMEVDGTDDTESKVPQYDTSEMVIA